MPLPIGIEARPETRSRRGVVSSLLRDRTALVGLVLVSLFVMIGCIAPLIVGHDPNLIDAMRRLEGPSRMHPFGTDNLGRDTFSRIVYGARWSLGAVAIATALIMSIGVGVGTLAGYFGGLIDEVLMRVVDVLLAFPSFLLAIAIAGMLGPGMASVIIALVSVWWASYARIVRGMVLSLRHREFVAAAKSLGADDVHIVFHHVLPNILAPVAILATVEMGELILAVAGLGFLGIGVQSPTPEWGTMVNDGRSYIMS
ncbi:MAG: ABC transporter permease, partial [Gemmatimonadaceae bacterium]